MAAKKSAKGKRTAGGLQKAAALLQHHFGRIALDTITSSFRTYPMPARVDVDRALQQVLAQYRGTRQLGLHVEHLYDSLTVSHLLGNRHAEVFVGPLQHEQIDTGEEEPTSCVKLAMWLGRQGRLPFALIAGPAKRHGRDSGVHVEIAVPAGEAAAALTRTLFQRLDERVRLAPAYRGRVISLEENGSYEGGAGAVRVHKLRHVEAAQVILPQRTLALVDRNVIGFVAQRERLRAFGLPAKKGLLFYGPPGTGETHTLHYLAGRLEGHTTLLITSEQVGLLEDAEILFVLTTNRPEHLEAALAARPGRIDQAIEFPLPDEDGRRRLARLYGAGLTMDESLLDLVVRWTQGASGAFLKELMRRAAQFLLESGDEALNAAHLESAIGEMLFDGGSLNRKLLGGERIPASQGE